MSAPMDWRWFADGTHPASDLSGDAVRAIAAYIAQDFLKDVR